jgi:diketogulonate reductase-like aldo/keto reductase
MEQMVEKGKVRAIGISNCGIPLIEHLLKTAKIVPAVNQVRSIYVCVGIELMLLGVVIG